MSMMSTAKVKDGRLIADPAAELPEGATVTVLFNDNADGDDLELTPEEGPSSTMRSRRRIVTGGFLPSK